MQVSSPPPLEPPLQVNSREMQHKDRGRGHEERKRERESPPRNETTGPSEWTSSRPFTTPLIAPFSSGRHPTPSVNTGGRRVTHLTPRRTGMVLTRNDVRTKGRRRNCAVLTRQSGVRGGGFFPRPCHNCLQFIPEGSSLFRICFQPPPPAPGVMAPSVSLPGRVCTEVERSVEAELAFKLARSGVAKFICCRRMYLFFLGQW